LIAASHADAALTNAMDAVAIASRARGLSRASFVLHHRNTCVSRSSTWSCTRRREQVWRQRRVEVVGDLHAALPAARNPPDGARFQRYQARKGHAVLGDDDLFARCRPVDELREIRLGS
jgi:hypothetical protein